MSVEVALRHDAQPMHWPERLLIGFVVLLALACSLTADWSMRNNLQFACYLAICVLASGMKVSLPGVFGTMSVSFLFVLLGIQDLSAGQLLVVGCAGALAQSVWKARHGIHALRAAFSVANLAVAAFGANALYHWPMAQRISSGSPLALIGASLAYFLLNTLGVSAATALSERKRMVDTWRDCYFWSFPFYLVGASVAWMFSLLTERGHLQSSLLLAPVIYAIYRVYRMYLSHLEDERKHVEQMAALHLRTIEALALAIDAKDHATHEHLSRVRTYAVELGKEMRLPDAELEALRAAALLHDIGKLAVPEHIISKPGKLTPEEFEKMKIHPVVGAEILERVEFPYPVVPIVRSHHEKWDGTGYPDGLKHDEIPMGARILAAVDCLDALASDRQYRRALPLDEAMAEVRKLSGMAFDPDVVELLGRKYVELERLATNQPAPMAKLSRDIRIARGAAPAAGFEVCEPCNRPPAKDFEFLDSIAAARQEVQLLFELTRDLGKSLSVDETLSMVGARLKRLIPHAAIAAYLTRDGRLVPEYVNGENLGEFPGLEIPVGSGVSGWVAETGRPVLNGNPAVESEQLAGHAGTLRSALSVPLVGLTGTIGVLTLYRGEKDAFSSDHLRVLLAVTSKVSLAMENALKFRQVESTAATDYLTGLPNARALFLRLDGELSRSKRAREPLTVLVCDLDGFKMVNDCLGHMVGNKVLRAVGSALRDSCREYDYVARMGGDEFALILPASDRESMRHRIAELREIGGAAASDIAGMPSMTMSVGEAAYPEDGSDAEQLLAEADRRMVRSKSQNRRVRPAIAAVQPPAYSQVQ